MEYPLIKNGRRIGWLKQEKKGLMTVFTAEAADDGDFLRISVYGDGCEGRLGLMVPENGILRLRKSFSRSAMSEFPSNIEFASECGQRHSCQKTEKTVPAKPETPKICDVTDEEEPLQWYSAPDGSLRAHDGKRSLVAMPTDLVRLPEGTRGDMRNIEGRDYLVFSK